MLFRDFNIIAAAAYAASRAADISQIPGQHSAALWEELSEEQQADAMQRIMAIARNERDADKVFEDTALAILGHNGGQGGLALEEIAAIGAAVFDNGLSTEEEVGGRSIREVVEVLLQELAGVRNVLGSLGHLSTFYAERQKEALAAEEAAEAAAEAQAAEPQAETVN
jgi:hypothetical protein